MILLVFLQDPVGNIIQQWSDLQNADHGVVSGETVMSDNPILGDWVISITANVSNSTSQLHLGVDSAKRVLLPFVDQGFGQYKNPFSLCIKMYVL